MDFLILCICTLCVLITVLLWLSLYILLGWLCQLSLMSEHIYNSYIDVPYQIWISPSVHMAIFLRTLTTADARLCTASASYAYALILSWVPTCAPLVSTPSILINTRNDGDTHYAWGFIAPSILHCHLQILDLAGGIVHGISLIMPC